MRDLIATIPAKLRLEVALDDDGEGGIGEACVYFDPRAMSADGEPDIGPRVVAQLRRIVEDDESWPGIEVQRSSVPLALVDLVPGAGERTTHLVVLEVDARDCDEPGAWNWPELIGANAQVRAVYDIRPDATSSSPKGS